MVNNTYLLIKVMLLTGAEPEIVRVVGAATNLRHQIQQHQSEKST